MKENKTKPDIRFKGFTEAWEQRKFVRVFDGLQNNTLSRADLNYEGGTVKNVHYGDVLIKFGDYIDASKTELPYISDSTKADKFKSSFLQDGDIIIADTAEDDTVGKCTEIQGSEGLKLLSGLHTVACRPKEKYGQMFLGYYINSPAYHNQLKPLMQGIKVTSISKSALQDTDMIMPKSIDEQIRIGEYFSTLDNLITLHQRECDQLKELKKSMLKKMFPRDESSIPEVRFAGFTDAWEQRKLGEVVEFYNGDRSSRYPTDSDIVPDGIPFINAGDLVSGRVKLDTANKITKEKYNELSGAKIQRGDIIYCLRGTLGKNAFIDNFDSGTVASSLVDIRPKKIVGKYLFQVLNSDIEYRQRTINDEGAAQPNLSAKNLSLFDIPMSNKDEQTKIAEYFSNLDNLITLHQRNYNSLNRCKFSKITKNLLISHMVFIRK